MAWGISGGARMKGNGGFVCLWRSLLGHPAFRNEGEAMAFGWLVLNAQWKPARVRYKERIFHLQRGQLAVSVSGTWRAGWSGRGRGLSVF
jgi:hypothetical protein